MKNLYVSLLGFVLALGVRVSGESLSLPDNPEEAWVALQKAVKPPLPPAEWNQKAPSEEEYAAFRGRLGKAAGSGADLAKAFAEKFPKHEKAGEALEQRKKLLQAAAQFGDKSRAEELASVPSATPPGTRKGGAASEENDSAPQTPGAAGFQGKFQAVVEHARAQSTAGMEAVYKDFENGLRGLQKDHPDELRIYGGFLEVAQGLGGAHGLALAREVLAKPVAAPLHPAATQIVSRLGRVGSVLDLKFKASDGKEFDLVSLKGKVVLVDFWATWCGPCVAEVPNVVAAYERLHPKGFEIVGISFDQDKDALESFVKRKKMPWVQYFDGLGWENKLGREFGISSVPTMWLVDKQGKLREMNARDNLVARVEKLLAEP